MKKHGVLLAILLLGLALRLPGVFWGLKDGVFVEHHPDEWNLAVLSNEFLSDDPHVERFIYPRGFGLIFAGVRAIDRALTGDSEKSRWRSAFLPGRLLSVVSGVLTIWVVYLLAFHLSRSRLAALIAALAMATSPLHVTNSHYLTADSLSVLVSCLAILGLVKAAETGSLVKLLFASAIIGFGVAVKLALAPLIGIAVVLLLARFPPGAPLRLEMAGACLALVVTMLIIGNGGNLDVLRKHYQILLNDNLFVKDHPKYLNPLIYAVILLPGLGLPVFVLAARFLVRQVRFFSWSKENIIRHAAPIAVVAIGLTQVALISNMSIPMARHALLLVPILCLCAGVSGADALSRLSHWTRATAIGLFMVWQIFSVLSIEVYFLKNLRLETAEWMQKNLEPGPIIAHRYTPYYVPGFPGNSSLEAARYIIADERLTVFMDRSPFNPFGPADCDSRLFHITKDMCADYEQIKNGDGFVLRKEFLMTPLAPEQWLYDRLWGTHPIYIGDVRIYEAATAPSGMQRGHMVTGS